MPWPHHKKTLHLSTCTICWEYISICFYCLKLAQNEENLSKWAPSLNSPSHISIHTSSTIVHTENHSPLIQSNIHLSIYIPAIYQPHLHSSNFPENPSSSAQPNMSPQNLTQNHVSPTTSVSKNSSPSVTMHKQVISPSSTPYDAFDNNISSSQKNVSRPPSPTLMETNCVTIRA